MTTWQPDGWLSAAAHLPSPNFGERPTGSVVSLLLLHNISLPPDEFGGDWVEDFFLNRLDPTVNPYFSTISDLQVSAHFYVRRDGRIIQFVGCDQRAWHAGQSSWSGSENCNDYSVGIELEGSDFQPYEAVQYEALWPLLDALQARYPIQAIAGHCHVAPGRKTDPGPCFDWPAVCLRYPNLILPPEIAT